MSTKVSIFRHGDTLGQAAEELGALIKRSKNIKVSSMARGANPELIAAYRVQKMLKLALCVTHGALQRQESRGAHFREDYPLRNDEQWLCRTLASWKDADALVPELQYEALDVKKMELPPGWRGYGGKERIEHPDTELRSQEIEQIKQQAAANGQDDRYQIQEKSMPYQEMLPEALRGRNARLNLKGEGDL